MEEQRSQELDRETFESWGSIVIARITKLLSPSVFTNAAVVGFNRETQEIRISSTIYFDHNPNELFLAKLQEKTGVHLEKDELPGKYYAVLGLDQFCTMVMAGLQEPSDADALQAKVEMLKEYLHL